MLSGIVKSGEDQKVFPVPAIPQIPPTWNTQYTKVPYFGGSMS